MSDVFHAECAGPAGASGTPATVGTLIASTSIRGFIEAWHLGVSSAPSDHSLNWLLQRFTADGTPGSAVTPGPGDPAAPASLITSGQAYSAEPTYTSAKEMWAKGYNARASDSIFLARGREIIIPATSGNGVGMKVADATTGPPTCQLTLDFHQ